MMNKVKWISVVLCVVVVLGCCVGYKTIVSYSAYDIARPDFYSVISSYDTEAVWTVPASEALEYGAYAEEDMQVFEITYELYNPFNDIIKFYGNLCSYTDVDGHRVLAYEPVGSNSDISEYRNSKILPPGESMTFMEYVLVPEGTEKIYARGKNFGAAESVLIKLQ